MELTTFQPPEIYDKNGDLIRSGAWGPNTPFFDGKGTGIYDYIANNLENLQNGVGGAAQNAADAKEASDNATAKSNEATARLAEIRLVLEDAIAAKNAALAAQAAAELAEAGAAAITTPEGLAARVLALEALPHFEYDANGNLYFCFGL